MSVTGVYYCFLLHLARVSVLDDGGALPINDTNSNSNNKYYYVLSSYFVSGTGLSSLHARFYPPT